MKKIHFLIGSLEIGGAEKHLANICRGLRLIGFDLEVVVLTSKGPLSYIFEDNKINVLYPTESLISKIRILPLFLKRVIRISYLIIWLYWYYKKNPNDIFHFFLPESYIIGMTARILTNFKGKTVMSRRSLNYYQNKRWGVYKIEKIFHRYVDFVLGNSQLVCEQLQKEGLNQNKLDLIYNGVDTSIYCPLAKDPNFKKQIDISNDHIVFIIVANLIPYKGHEDLLKALTIVNQCTKKWCLLCIGKDNGIGISLKIKAETLGIAPQIRWMSSILNVPYYLNNSDIGILCSHQEGFSNAILEGMACGLPMVVTDAGGNKEAVQDGVNGKVVPIKNPELLAKALIELLGNANLRKQISLNNIQRIKNYFSQEQCVEAYKKFYSTKCK